jgi:hypothetical protein
MDTSTNHLVSPERFQHMDPAAARSYTPVPKHLRPAAMRKLAGRREAHVALHSGGKLSVWAAEQRRQQRKAAKRNSATRSKARQRMAKESRRRNRRK